MNRQTGWDRGRLKWDAQLIAGGTPSTDDPSYWLDGDDSAGIPFVAIGDMSRRQTVTSTSKRVTYEALQSRNMPVGPRGTILLAMYASVGEVSRLGIDATWNQAILGIESDLSRVDPRFLVYYLLSARDVLLSEVRSNTQSNLNARQIGDLWYARPPVSEQITIADFLDRETEKIDTLIAKQEQMIETLRERRTAIISRSFGLIANPLAYQGGFVSLRRSFAVALGKMLDAGRSARTNDIELPYLRAANVQPDHLDLSSVNRMPYAPDEAKALDLRQNDLLVVEGGAGFGNAIVLTEDMPGWSFQKTLNRVRPLAGGSSAFLALVLRAYRDAGVLDIVCNKSTIPHLTAEKLLDLPIPDVSVEAQHSIAAGVAAGIAEIDALIAKAQEFIMLAKERRSALITATVTGQIDVSTAA